MVDKNAYHESYVEHEIEGRPPPRVHYEAPGKFDKLFALYAIGTIRLSGSAHSVATALIWHANKASGRCDPGQVRLAYETRLCPRAVRKAVSELLNRGVLLKRTRRANSTNAYQLNWKGLRQEFQIFERRAASLRQNEGKPNGFDEREEEAIGTNVPIGKERACHSMRHDRSSKPFNEPFENNTGRETVPFGPNGPQGTSPPHRDYPSDVSLVTQRQSEGAKGSPVQEIPHGCQEERNRTRITDRNVNEWWWRRKHRELLAELERCDDPKHRKELEQRLARAEAHVSSNAAA